MYFFCGWCILLSEVIDHLIISTSDIYVQNIWTSQIIIFKYNKYYFLPKHFPKLWIFKNVNFASVTVNILPLMYNHRRNMTKQKYSNESRILPETAWIPIKKAPKLRQHPPCLRFHAYCYCIQSKSSSYMQWANNEIQFPLKTLILSEHCEHSPQQRPFSDRMRL